MLTATALFTPPAVLPAKRPYMAPALVVHGDVHTLTQAAGNQPQGPGTSLLSDPQG